MDTFYCQNLSVLSMFHHCRFSPLLTLISIKGFTVVVVVLKFIISDLDNGHCFTAQLTLNEKLYTKNK